MHAPWPGSFDLHCKLYLLYPIPVRYQPPQRSCDNQKKLLPDIWGRGGLVVNTSDSGSRGWGFEPHSGRRVVSLSKTYLPPKSTGNTQEVVAPSQHDWKIVYRDVKHQTKPKLPDIRAWYKHNICAWVESWSCDQDPYKFWWETNTGLWETLYKGLWETLYRLVRN